MADLSVVVCTHERPEDLKRCLDGLASQEEAIEVIVVDSASQAPVRPVVDAFAARIPQLSYIWVGEPGLSAARNAGVTASGGSIVAFVDDDATPAPDWSRAMRAAFARPEVGCVGGACRAAFVTRRPPWLSERLLQLAGVTRFGDRAREPRSSSEWPFGANMAFRRTALEAAGPFSTRLGRRGRSLLSGEDSDMVARVQQSGWRTWLEPAAVVDHAVGAERCRSAYYWRRLWWNGVSRAAYPNRAVALRLLLAAPLRLIMWGASGERLYLYRLAETVGYFAARLGLTDPG